MRGREGSKGLEWGQFVTRPPVEAAGSYFLFAVCAYLPTTYTYYYVLRRRTTSQPMTVVTVRTEITLLQLLRGLVRHRAAFLSSFSSRYTPPDPCLRPEKLARLSIHRHVHRLPLYPDTYSFLPAYLPFFSRVIAINQPDHPRRQLSRFFTNV